MPTYPLPLSAYPISWDLLSSWLLKESRRTLSAWSRVWHGLKWEGRYWKRKWLPFPERAPLFWQAGWVMSWRNRLRPLLPMCAVVPNRWIFPSTSIRRRTYTFICLKALFLKTDLRRVLPWLRPLRQHLRDNLCAMMWPWQEKLRCAVMFFL